MLARFPRALLALAAFAAAGAAQAANLDIDLGTMLPNQHLSFSETAASFTDTYSLTVGDPVDFKFAFSNLGLGSNATIGVALNGNQIVGAFGRNIEWSWGPFGAPPPFGTGSEFTITISGTDNTLDTASYVFEVFTAGQGGIAPVPEPASWALMLGGAAVLGAWRRRRRS